MNLREEIDKSLDGLPKETLDGVLEYIRFVNESSLMVSHIVGKHHLLSFRRRPESSASSHSRVFWTQVFTGVTKFRNSSSSCAQIPDLKFEIQNPKQYQNSNARNPKRPELWPQHRCYLGFEHSSLGHSNLFRISNFGFHKDRWLYRFEAKLH
jgi:hypothetical protein